MFLSSGCEQRHGSDQRQAFFLLPQYISWLASHGMTRVANRCPQEWLYYQSKALGRECILHFHCQ